MDGPVGNAENIVNYILESNKFKSDGVDHRAFLPGSDGERSVFRVDGLTDRQISVIGREHVAQPRSKPLLGWARTTAQIVRKAVPLEIHEDEPPERHAVIINWPDSTAKEQRRALAMILASGCDVVKCQSANPS